MFKPEELNLELIDAKGNPNAAYYPPILDKDPHFAAQFLTIKDTEEVYKRMKEMYKELETPKEEIINSYVVLKDSVMRGVKNFLWFSRFFKEVEVILSETTNLVEDSFLIPHHVSEKLSTHKKVTWRPPLELSTRKVKVREQKITLRNQDPINKHRVAYIKRNLELEEFRDGFPAWYLMQDTTVYENYNPKTNVRVRIDFRDGEFMYFICGASDNWQQIYDVPLEMDNVVSALLFRI